MVDEIALQIEVQKVNVKPRRCKSKRISELHKNNLLVKKSVQIYEKYGIFSYGRRDSLWLNILISQMI